MDRRDISIEKSVKWNREHTEQRKKIVQDFNQSDPERIREYNRKYNRSEKGKAKCHNKRLKRKNLLEEFSAITP